MWTVYFVNTVNQQQAKKKTMATTTTKKSRKNSPKPTNDEIFSNRENVSQNTWNSFTTTDLTNLLDQQPTFFQQPLESSRPTLY